MSEPAIHYGAARRGVGFTEVSQAADALLRAGERPTVERIRARVGSGSPNTVGPLLDEWWKRLAGRLDAGPAALHRLPETVAHIAEALWLQALEEARGRALIEQSGERRALADDKEHIEVRSHVLSLREAEMDLRIKEREKTIVDLEKRIQVLSVALTREKAARRQEDTARRKTRTGNAASGRMVRQMRRPR
jgi:hypothetical protein